MTERTRVITLLDELQAAERAGAAALGEWAAGCRDPALRGGLQVLGARDAAHAALAEARLRALGGEPSAQAGRNLQSLCSVLGTPDVSDRSKLTLLLSRFPDRVHDPFVQFASQLTDEETRALLETIGDDERASLRWLREDAGGDTPAPPEDGRRAAAVAFMDALAAAEASGAQVFEAWIAVCGIAGLRGGLRTAAARERTHATLLLDRLRALGVAPTASVPEPVRRAALARFGDRDVSDEEKLGAIIARYPHGHDPGAPIAAAADELAPDLETRNVLRLVAAVETTTIGWLRAYHAALTGGMRAG